MQSSGGFNPIINQSTKHTQCYFIQLKSKTGLCFIRCMFCDGVATSEDPRTGGEEGAGKAELFLLVHRRMPRSRSLPTRGARYPARNARSAPLTAVCHNYASEFAALRKNGAIWGLGQTSVAGSSLPLAQSPAPRTAEFPDAHPHITHTGTIFTMPKPKTPVNGVWERLASAKHQLTVFGGADIITLVS